MIKVEGGTAVRLLILCSVLCNQTSLVNFANMTAEPEHDRISRIQNAPQQILSLSRHNLEAVVSCALNLEAGRQYLL